MGKLRKSALPVLICGFDGRPCNVPREKWIGDAPACAGVVFFGILASNGVEEQAVPPCARFAIAGGVSKFVDKATVEIVTHKRARKSKPVS